MTHETTIKKEVFESLIGCTTYIDKTDGYLIIDSKSTVLTIANNSANKAVCVVGMLVGVRKHGGLLVQYGQVTICLYNKKYTKII